MPERYDDQTTLALQHLVQCGYCRADIKDHGLHEPLVRPCSTATAERRLASSTQEISWTARNPVR